MWHNIPAELRQLQQWVVSGPNKIPLSPRTGQPASVTDPRTWATFEEAIRSGYQHIGFVLTEADPYAIIDLDNKPDDPVGPEESKVHEEILRVFETYTERSASGRGYHIIVKGKIPAGVHRGHVEVYSSARYMICTGNVVRQMPITEYQAGLDYLYGQMKPAEQVPLEDRESPLDDRELVDMAMRAENADKFNALCTGGWRELGYPSQSEADFALLAILAFYSPDNEQVRRVFRYSGLGKRDKATRDNRYLDRALSKIRAVQSPRLDLSLLRAQAEAIVKASQSVTGGRSQGVPNPPPPSQKPPINEISNEVPGEIPSVPPGIVGDIARYYYSSAIRPVPDIALTAAIATVAGMCGRAFNISGTGLNQYLILVAKTGVGKEGAASGIDNLVAAVRPQVPMVDQFVGPSAFASGQALIKILDDKPCFVSVLGEFGLTLQQLCAPDASAPQVMLRKVLLDLYTKSGGNKVLRESAYSDKDKTTKIVASPSVTILAESTPTTFFDGLDASHIAEGLIPRFSIVEYGGARPPRNPNANHPPDQQLVARVAELAAIALTAANQNTVTPVQLDSDATKLLDALDKEADAVINGTSSEIENELWNRVHLKALKLSALLAVGVNPHQPIVSGPMAEWSIEFIRKEVKAVSTRFKAGDVGRGDGKQLNDLKRVIKGYLKTDYDVAKSYQVERNVWEAKGIPYSYLQRRTANLSSFRGDRRGSTTALRNSIQNLVDSGMLAELPKVQTYEKFKSSAKVYFAIGNSWV